MGLVLAFTLPCFAKKEVPISGKWNKEIRTIIPQLPIRAWIEDNNKDLLLEFSSNLGILEVTVTNASGKVVYSKSIDTRVSSSTCITLNEEINKGDVLFITDGSNIIHGNLF